MNICIHHLGFSAFVDGSDEGIEKISLSEGKRLEIYLNEPLSITKEYEVELLGIKEIYSSTTLAKTKFTVRINGLFILEEKIASESKSYSSLIRNNSSLNETVTFVIAAKDKQGKRILNVKVITKTVPGSGGEAEFSHTFSALEGECSIERYGFSDFGNLVSDIKSGT